MSKHLFVNTPFYTNNIIFHHEYFAPLLVNAIHGREFNNSTKSDLLFRISYFLENQYSTNAGEKQNQYSTDIRLSEAGDTAP